MTTTHSTSRATGFDNEVYLEAQAAAIRERVEMFSGKLYLEFGGKLLHDMHAARVLPGYDPDVKIKLLAASGTWSRSCSASTPRTSRTGGSVATSG